MKAVVTWGECHADAVLFRGFLRDLALEWMHARSRGYNSIGRFAGTERIKTLFSRSSFKADQFWQVTPAQAVTFDKALHALLTSPKGAGLSRMVGPLHGYHKQLVGYTLNGRRYVYANLYPESDLEMPVIGQLLRQWEPEKAMDVCDGGHRYWGAILDLQTVAIRSADNNGALGLPGCHWDFSRASIPIEQSACKP